MTSSTCRLGPGPRPAALLAVCVALALCALALAAARAADGRWPDPARLADEVRAFARADSASPPPAGAIVCTGSSTIRMWRPRLAKDLAPLTVVPRGFGGSTMEDLAVDLEPLVLRARPRAVVIYEGDNDLLEGLSPAAILAVLDSIVVRLHGALPSARVYVLSVKPCPSRRALWPAAVTLNRLFRDVCAGDSLLTFVDVATPMLDRNGSPRPELFGPDSLHMNDRGYELWRDALAPVLRAREARFER